MFRNVQSIQHVTVRIKPTSCNKTCISPGDVLPSFSSFFFFSSLAHNSTSQNWPKSKLAEVEISRSQNWPKANWPKSKKCFGLKRNCPKSTATTGTAPSGTATTLDHPPCTPHPVPHTLYPTPCTPHPVPHTLHPTPCTPHPAPCTPRGSILIGPIQSYAQPLFSYSNVTQAMPEYWSTYCQSGQLWAKQFCELTLSSPPVGGWQCSCLCEDVTLRRQATPSHKHSLCTLFGISTANVVESPKLGVYVEGLKVEGWGLRVEGWGFKVQGLRFQGSKVPRFQGSKVPRFKVQGLRCKV